MMDKDDKAVKDMILYAEVLADETLAKMDDEEALKMVRDFTEVMINWQPVIAEASKEPVDMGIHCLTLAELFKLAFVKAYSHTAKRLDAIESIKRAFDS